jgi:hypothetical protein
MTSSPDTPSRRDLRDAAVAAVLARAVRAGEVEPSDALRIIKHEMRRRNTNQKLNIEMRSIAAQAVVEKYSTLRQPIPNNNSPEALHADHVHAFTETDLRGTDSIDDWLVQLTRLREVVCVTAEENYTLEKIEKSGMTGAAKYAKANITWAPKISPLLAEVVEASGSEVQIV